MITQALAQAVLAAALETGGDFSELYLEDTESNDLSMMGGTVENATYSRRHGAGVRVLKGTRYAYAYTADTSEQALLATARAAAAAISGDERFSVRPFAVTDCRKAPVIAAADVNRACLPMTAAPAPASTCRQLPPTAPRPRPDAPVPAGAAATSCLTRWIPLSWVCRQPRRPSPCSTRSTAPPVCSRW